MHDHPVTRDERTVAVENASYRMACIILTFGILIDVCVRGIAFGQASWDLLGLVVLSGGVATFYQARRQTLAPRWSRVAILAAAVGAAAGLAAIVAVMLLKR